jgi:hypothetical protein
MFNTTFHNLIYNETLNEMRTAFVRHYFKGEFFFFKGPRQEIIFIIITIIILL